jgi:hypothetical protein
MIDPMAMEEDNTVPYRSVQHCTQLRDTECLCPVLTVSKRTISQRHFTFSRPSFCCMELPVTGNGPKQL